MLIGGRAALVVLAAAAPLFQRWRRSVLAWICTALFGPSRFSCATAHGAHLSNVLVALGASYSPATLTALDFGTARVPVITSDCPGVACRGRCCPIRVEQLVFDLCALHDAGALRECSRDRLPKIPSPMSELRLRLNWWLGRPPLSCVMITSGAAHTYPESIHLHNDDNVDSSVPTSTSVPLSTPEVPRDGRATNVPLHGRIFIRGLGWIPNEQRPNRPRGRALPVAFATLRQWQRWRSWQHRCLVRAPLHRLALAQQLALALGGIFAGGSRGFLYPYWLLRAGDTWRSAARSACVEHAACVDRGRLRRVSVGAARTVAMRMGTDATQMLAECGQFPYANKRGQRYMQEVRFRFHNVCGMRSDRSAREAYLRAGGDVCDVLVLAETNCVGGEQVERQWGRAWPNGYEALWASDTQGRVARGMWLCSFQSASLKQTHAWHSPTPRVDSLLSGSPSLADAPSSSAPTQTMHLMRTRPRSMSACGLDYQHPRLIRMLSGSEI